MQPVFPLAPCQLALPDVPFRVEKHVRASPCRSSRTRLRPRSRPHTTFRTPPRTQMSHRMRQADGDLPGRPSPWTGSTPPAARGRGPPPRLLREPPLGPAHRGPPALPRRGGAARGGGRGQLDLTAADLHRGAGRRSPRRSSDGATPEAQLGTLAAHTALRAAQAAYDARSATRSSSASTRRAGRTGWTTTLARIAIRGSGHDAEEEWVGHGRRSCAACPGPARPAGRPGALRAGSVRGARLDAGRTGLPAGSRRPRVNRTSRVRAVRA